MSTFKVGDRVKVVGKSVIAGEVGTILVLKDHLIGVEFDEKVTGGHSLASATSDIQCKESHGYWLIESNLELLTKSESESKPESAFNHQVAGNHYKTLGIQPLEACYINRGYEAFSGACYTKVLKYMDRKKDNQVEQLKKARHVLDMWIEKAEEQ